MTKRQAQNIAAVLGKSNHRLIQFNDSDRGWGVVVACNDHDSATKGCLVIADGHITQLIGVRVDQYEPNVMYNEDILLSVTINYFDPPPEEDEPD